MTRTLGVVALAGQDQYEYIRDLSAGAHGIVQLARDTSDNSLVSLPFATIFEMILFHVNLQVTALVFTAGSHQISLTWEKDCR